MRDSHPQVSCPLCTSSNVSVLHTTHAVLYVACLECDHTWQQTLEAVDPPRRTSAAFRMTVRVVARHAARPLTV